MSKSGTSSLVHDGDKVVILLNSKKYYFVSVTGESKINLGKHTLISSTVVGKPYGGAFLLHNGVLKQAQPLSNSTMSSASTVSPINIQENNSKLNDDNTSQKLSQADIVSMKEKGLSGEDVVKAIISNSSTFQTKTEYSKEKYIKKKQQKHMVFLKLIKPSAKSLIKAYNFMDSSKICYLREDSLAQLLALANVKAHSLPLLVETCQGLVLGSVAERMGGHGRVLNGYVNSHPADPIFKLFELPTQAGCIVSFRLSSIEEIVQQRLKVGDTPDSGANVLQDREVMEIEVKEQKCTEQSYNDPQKSYISTITEGSSQVNKTAIEIRQVLDTLKENLADSLIIVSKYDPKPLLLGLLPLLEIGCPFVLFSQHIQPLIECHKAVRSTATNLSLSETWTRVQQVLPNRTHPMMQMDGASGYLLSGIHVANALPPQSTNESPAKRSRIV